MPETKLFHIGDILSITDGRLVSTRHMDGVREIIAFMVGGEPFDMGLVAARGPCAAALLALHPHLAEVVEPAAELNAETIPAWLAKQVEKFGEMLPVRRLAP